MSIDSAESETRVTRPTTFAFVDEDGDACVTGTESVAVLVAVAAGPADLREDDGGDEACVAGAGGDEVGCSHDVTVFGSTVVDVVFGIVVCGVTLAVFFFVACARTIESDEIDDGEVGVGAAVAVAAFLGVDRAEATLAGAAVPASLGFGAGTGAGAGVESIGGVCFLVDDDDADDDGCGGWVDFFEESTVVVVVVVSFVFCTSAPPTFFVDFVEFALADGDGRGEPTTPPAAVDLVGELTGTDLPGLDAGVAVGAAAASGGTGAASFVVCFDVFVFLFDAAFDLFVVVVVVAVVVDAAVVVVASLFVVTPAFF